MEERSRIRFNPATKEIEIEGSEEFVRIYFGKVQKLLLATVGGKEEKPKSPRIRPAGKPKKMKKKPGPKKGPKRPKIRRKPSWTRSSGSSAAAKRGSRRRR